jgi:hypothetical protein
MGLASCTISVSAKMSEPKVESQSSAVDLVLSAHHDESSVWSSLARTVVSDG